MLQFLCQNEGNSQQETTCTFGTNRPVNIADIGQQKVAAH